MKEVADLKELRMHVARLPSIIADGYLWCDAEILRRSPPGTTIGMSSIKRRRLELLSTVHWVIDKDGACSMGDVQKGTYARNERKQQFTPSQIALAGDALKRHGWVNEKALESTFPSHSGT